ncbi:RING-H2 finger protein ATL43 [Lactuca sativa]|uniref:RING-H2 finger protein ATL43 n=1 Tax=Lactuca sativa TaxID=4236 RepID=UPI000CD82A28|nr:RING-H2 finger protein ATL43 [Lactuca sativa]
MGFKSPWHPTPLMIFLVSTTPSITTSSPLPPPPRSLPPPPSSTLKPSMTIIVGVVTTIFSITFLILLYAKHCRRSNNDYPPRGDVTAGRSTDRGNSGIDRTIIESLPVFRFGSLSGQKDGLECAVCLSRFDPSEVLRLLPKCKHAFHVECVDTWLDAHSTCPLCRYRVDPEDIFLVLGENDIEKSPEEVKAAEEEREIAVRRVSGRHSSAGENGTGLQISVEPSSPLPAAVAMAGSRRSLDSWSSKKCKKSTKKTKKKEDTAPLKAVSEVCVDGQHRKDGNLLAAVEEERRRKRRSFEKRFEHRIVVGTTTGPHRWSDVQPSDLLYLRSEMILSDVRRLKRSRPSVLHEGNNVWWQSGRGVINSRSVSEMTGLSRFGSNEEAGVLSRWLARLSEPKSGRNSSSSNV